MAGRQCVCVKEMMTLGCVCFCFCFFYAGAGRPSNKPSHTGLTTSRMSAARKTNRHTQGRRLDAFPACVCCSCEQTVSERGKFD